MHDLFSWDDRESTGGQSDAPSARELFSRTAGTGNLGEQEASWMEKLFQRILNPDGGEILRPGEGRRITEAVEQWHLQESHCSCAVCAQQFIINEFTGLHLTEAELCRFAEQNGWFDPENGTSPLNVGKLLEAFGLETQVRFDTSFEDLRKTLEEGGRAVVTVDSMVLWVDGYGNYPVSGADHAIEVIGIDDSNPADVCAIINDSGIENGGGQRVPYREFMEAWNASGGFMVSAFPGNGT